MSTLYSSFFDTIIIGGGIAGLYAAYRILQENPLTKLIVIEKEKNLGGRAKNDLFYGVPIVTGAGIGRFDKDKLLHKLINKFNLPIHYFKTSHQYTKDINLSIKDVNHIWKYLKDEFIEHPISCTFKEFALHKLGKKNYYDFITFAGFTDYENENAYDTLFLYGFEDNITDWNGFSVPWNELVKSLEKFIGPTHFLLQKEVIRITPSYSNFSIKLNDNTTLLSKNVILATTISSVLNLVHVYTKFYKQIKSQPFLRVYGKFSNESSILMKEHIKTTTIVKGVLQKILPINADKGIYMISYSDNKNAMQLYPYISNTEKNRSYFSYLLEVALDLPIHSLKLIGIKSYFWSTGTHYYQPTDEIRDDFIYRLQHPLPKLFVVGEMISLNQGWTEGALESVEEIIDEITPI